MQFLAALVEHFVVGVVALLWVLPFLHKYSLIPSGNLAESKEIVLAVGIPAVYVIGMFVDVFSSIFTAWIRLGFDFISRSNEFFTDGVSAKLIRKHYKDTINARNPTLTTASVSASSEGKSYDRTVRILNDSPDEKAKHLLQLSGREKIARGVFCNLVVATILNACFDKSVYTVPALMLFFFALAGLFVWLRLAVLTDEFKRRMLGQ